MNDEKEAILAAVRTRIETLRLEAKGMVDDHWKFYLEESDARRDFADKSRLFPRIATTKNGFAIEWYYIRKWFKDKKEKWKKVTRYVSRGRSFRTNLEARAKPWELDVVTDFENRAEMIRREVTFLSVTIESYDRFDRLQEKRAEAALSEGLHYSGPV
ncbi:MAG: hypothetical protein A2286_07820 [Gammaproteobacteria bacterium RIFOXYA12_FULL_61_12]|nr:MAG: hypothetical protein A2514_07910 [Gammaproteobacteria bacterium RIFOXYD12_FULL_61_37]OGT91082.1 MAG: hypothetical protein A2286_07820 [Gammaproteobacteria bacterium RIFOXYA12_FULL_61_12]